ncbi:MAG: hypothetical protein PHU65_03790 [Actinomycetota bacterium]|nr:hypothetical protein [Actinomycetota bacterium]
MHKEVKEITDVCSSIIIKTQSIKEIAKEVQEQTKNIEENAQQADRPSKSLAMRKPLASLFILNSNFDDLIKNLEKIYDDLKKI